MPQIEVEFAIDANGILNVSATDKATGKSHNIQITGSSGMDKDEIERMKSDAETHAAEDKNRRELIELKNQAEQVSHQVRSQLEEHGDKVTPETRSNIESALSNLESKLKEDDRGAIEAAMKQLNDSAMELGKAVYEAASAEQPEAAGGEEAGSTGQEPADDVIDAEYEVKDES